jgi:hypothetical protein
MRRTCEAVGLERDALRVANDGKDAEIARLRERAERYDAEIETLRGIVYSLSLRVANQSELLTKRAERTTADELRDGEGEG